MSATTPVRWAIIGVGTAGRARARAILADPRSQLASAWRGRHLAALGLPEASDFDAALAAADAVAICSPSASHAEQVEAALVAGKHVVVEYPIAPSAREAERLFAMASSAKRILHVGHIGLWTAAAQTLRAQVHASTLTEVRLRFTAPGPEPGGRRLAMLNLARVHRLLHLAGPVAAVLAVEHEAACLRAELRMASGAFAQLEFRSAAGLTRHLQLHLEAPGRSWVQDGDGVVIDGSALTLQEVGSLFGIDHKHAMARITRAAAPTVTPAQEVHALQVVEALALGRIGPLPG